MPPDAAAGWAGASSGRRLSGGRLSGRRLSGRRLSGRRLSGRSLRCRGLGSRRFGRLVLGRSGGRAGTVADLREDRADLDRLVLLDEDLFDHATDGRRDLGVDLVGRDLEQTFVGLDGVADLLQPAGDRSLGDALAERGEDHGSAHGLVSFRMPMSF